MKIPVPRTIIEAYSPIILITWIFGIGVVEYPIGKPRRMISAFLSITNFLVILVFIGMENYVQIVELQGSKIAASNLNVNICFAVLFVGFSLCLGPARAKVLNKSFSKLSSVNQRFKILGIPNDYDLFFKNHIIQISVTFISMSMLMALDFRFIGFALPNETSRLGFILSGHYLLVFAIVIDQSFSGTIRYFCNRFQRLNELLMELNSLENGETVVTRYGQSTSQFPCACDLINEIYVNYSLSFATAKKQWLLYVIREARGVHRCLSMTAMELNEAFGIQVVLSVTLSFFLMTTLSFTTYVRYAATSSAILTLEILIGRFIAFTWLTFHVVKVLLVVGACERSSSEANQTGGLISKLLDLPISDVDIRNEMNIFSLQLIQNPLDFTANGFFPLNYGLIGGMIRSVTTYLIIMIQMRSIYEPEELNSVSNSTMFILHANNTH